MDLTRNPEHPLPTLSSLLEPGAPLLRTKIAIPQTRRALVPRPRLDALMEKCADTPLTLVSAPAGFGKTTLVAAWAAQSPMPTAWLGLDAEDDNPDRFVPYLLAAIERVRPDAGATGRALLQAPPPYPVKTILTHLLDDLEAVPKKLVLVLDNYHFIRAPLLEQTLAFLLEHALSNLRLILTTRADPPLPLARLRAHGHLNEIRAADLRFTRAEAAQFLNQVMQLALAEHELALIETRTEGWIAGLQLAALSMQGRPDRANFVQEFTGSHRYIFGYLFDEVLAQQPDHLQKFLLETSILERLSGPLCAAVTGQADAQTTLEYLERANLFVVPLDEERTWYRYHQLFGDMLASRLKKTNGDVRELHRRAGEWFARNGLHTHAISHAIAAHAYETAADLIEGSEVLPRGQWATVRGWIEQLPRPVWKARPQLCLTYARTLVFTGKRHAYQEPLRLAEEAWQREGNPIKLAEAFNMHAQMARLNGDAAQTALFARRVLALLPEDERAQRASGLQALGAAAQLAGDAAGAQALLEHARRLGQEAASPLTMLLSTALTGQVLVSLGRLHDAAETFRTIIAACGEQLLWPNILAHIGLGGVQYEWNDPESAERLLRHGLEMGVETDREIYLADGYLALARVLAARGQMDETDRALLRAKQLAAQLEHPRQQSAVKAVQLDLGRGSGLDAPSENDQVTYDRAPEFTAWAHRLILAKQPAEALALLHTLAQAAQAGGRAGDLLELQALTTLALLSQGKHAHAFELLGKVLEAAEPEGYLRLFLDRGAPMQALLLAFVRRAADATARARGNRILAAFHPPARSGPIPENQVPQRGPESGRLIDPLSTRELEILALIAEGHSNREIAVRLSLAESTVKVHTRNIYSKLDVNRRTQAVRRARTLGVL